MSPDHPAPRAPVPVSVPDTLSALPGLHLVRLTARHPRAALKAVEYAAARGLEIQSVTVRALGPRTEASFSFDQVSEPTARALADRLALQVGVTSVALEHHLGARAV